MKRGLRRLGRQPAAVAGLLLTFAVSAVAVLSDTIASGNPFTTSPDELFHPPSSSHLMGTDQLGRDIFTGVVRGAHSSMSVVAGVVVIAAALGVVLGTTIGLSGGWVDDVVMRVADIVQSVPRFFLAILVAGWFGPGRGTLIVLLGLTSWPIIARVVRAETLSLGQREYVAAARSVGASNARIILSHVLPNVAPSALVVIALTGSRVVLLEAGLAFLGLTDQNVMSWGSLLNNAQPYLEQAWWMSAFPGLAIAISVLGMNLLADGIAAALEPARARLALRGGDLGPVAAA